MTVFAGKAACLGMVVSAALAPWPVLSQETETGRKGVFSIGIDLEAGNNVNLKSNGNGSDYRASTRLGYDYRLKTETTELTFGLSANPEFVAHEDVTAQPKLTLGFTQRSARSELSFTADYQRSKVTDQSIAYETDGTPLYYDGTGERGLGSVTAKLTGGIDQPFVYVLGLNHSKVDYFGETAGDQSPTRNTGATLDLRADLSSTRQLGLSFSHRLYEVDNSAALSRRSDSARVSLSQRINAVTRLGFSVGHSKVESERVSGTTTVSGTTWGLSLTRDDPRGTTALSYDRSFSETGTRDDVLLSRKAETRLGKFDGSIGLTRGETGSTDVIAGLGYEMELPRDRLSLDLSRRITTNDAGEDVLLTQFAGNYAHEISSVNALNFGLTANLSEAPDEKRTRVDGSISYSHDLTPEAALSAGVRLGLSKRTGLDDTDRQALFISFDRRFETR